MNMCVQSRLLSQRVKPMEFAPDTDEVAERDPSGRYIRFNEILWKGESKTVYKAFDEVDGIEVAWNQVLMDDGAIRSQQEHLYSEVSLVKSLKHDNIIKYYFSWVDDANRTVNTITELFTSGSLRKYRKKHKKVELTAIKNWARQILRGLLYLHSHSPPIIHRDLSCDNIFINGNTGRVKIGDLGLAVVMHQPTTVKEELVDIYSFGMCIMEMVGGVSDPEVKRFIKKCLAPASLRSSAAELLEDPFLALTVPSSPPQVQSRKKSCCTESSDHSTIQVLKHNGVNSFLLSGREEGNDSISMTLRMKGDNYGGRAKNIDFLFHLQNDTTLSIAREMVDELNLRHEDAAQIAGLMDDLIIKIELTRNKLTPSHKSEEPSSSSCSGMSEDDEDQCDQQLKKELAAIHSGFKKIADLIEMLEREAIEKAKQRSAARKNPVR